MKIVSSTLNMQAVSTSASLRREVSPPAATFAAAAGGRSRPLAGPAPLPIPDPAPSPIPDEEQTLTARDRSTLELLHRMFGLARSQIPDPVLSRPQGQEQVQEQVQPSISVSTTTPASATAWSGTALVAIERSTSFQAQGQVQTADGRTLQFSVSFSLHAALLTTAEAGPPPTDPLVLDLGHTGPAWLGPTDHPFDLDSTGTADASLPGLNAGLFYLVRDRGGDGRIEDGKELFGPRSGDGFAELATLDDDGNGWIDAGDAAWTTLGLWRPGAAVRTLTAAGVGALATARASTAFTFSGPDGADRATLRASGVYLREDGRPGTIHQIDLRA